MNASYQIGESGYLAQMNQHLRMNPQILPLNQVKVTFRKSQQKYQQTLRPRKTRMKQMIALVSFQLTPMVKVQCQINQDLRHRMIALQLFNRKMKVVKKSNKIATKVSRTQVTLVKSMIKAIQIILVLHHQIVKAQIRIRIHPKTDPRTIWITKQKIRKPLQLTRQKILNFTTARLTLLKSKSFWRQIAVFKQSSTTRV